MALVTVQRSPSVSSSPPSSEYGSSVISAEEEEQKNRSLSEYYFAVKGFGVLLPKNECQLGRGRRTSSAPPDIQGHLQAMLHLLCQGDTLHMAVRLESQHIGRIRYLAVVGRVGRQDTEEDCLLGVDFTGEKPSIGLVVPVLADTAISLDGDGGFSVRTGGRKHIFKPISVQAMWSALQTLHKSSARAQDAHYFLGGINHDWVCYYERGVTSDQSCINEWNVMDSLESKRPPSPDSLTDKEETQLLIRSKLKEIMMSVDIDEVTSKYIRQRLEEDLAMDLFKFKSYIDQEMLVILGQMDAATEIFPHVYLGSEWNASNLDELQCNGVGYILNVTKEIDNFYPGTFDYLNIRVYDDEKTELLRHWDRTFRYITQVQEKNSKVLVHCKMGISRSASVVIAYAMKAFNMSLDEALALVKKKRSCIKPNQAFCNQLKTYEGILDASRQRHNILWRSKSETNLKSAAGQANRHNKSQQNTKSNDDVDQSNNTKNLRKSTEELPTYDTSMVKETRGQSLGLPDDHMAALLFPQNSEKGGSYFGESWRLSQSLNVQSWRAHVTLQQRDLRIMAVECPGDEDKDSPSVIETLLTPGEDMQSSEPVISQTKAVTQKHQAVLVSSQVWQEENKSEAEVNVNPVESPVGVLKESITWPAGTIRRNKGKNSDVKDGLLDEDIKPPDENEDVEEVKAEDTSQFKAVANMKAYGPAPYKSPTERESSTIPVELADEETVEATDSSSDHHHSNPALSICIPNSTNPLATTRSQPSVCTTISSTENLYTELNVDNRLNDSKTSTGSENISTLAPGTVRQHKEILESKSQEGSFSEVQKIQEKLFIPSYSRSKSSCDLETKAESDSAGSDNHNFSEKRAKFEGHLENESEKGKVRKITQAIEKQNEDEKMKQYKIEGIRKRSHSLERLSTSPSSPGSSQNGLLEQLLVQAQTDVRHMEMEENPMEEIRVKNLVGKFEDCQEQKPPRVQTRNTRAKSDSCTPDKFQPPVPQRKSSLDYNFKPIQRSQSQPPQTPVRQPTPGGSLPFSGKAPSHKPPPGGRGQALGTEVRQRKQQGKTHPLTKLTRATRENYHTM
ncbi:hypothetical protein O3P69_000709 [Scylla paramamosain]|uniref:protein-serine/threonine phosphatase n=3 Tax=Scylla paramamosain TaxID=85552 RepID=A0AAW0UR16_SCYPA